MRAETTGLRSRRTSPPFSSRSAAPKPTDAPEILDRRQLLGALTRLKKGDFAVRLGVGLSGVDGKIADAFNDVVELNQRMSLSSLG